MAEDHNEPLVLRQVKQLFSNMLAELPERSAVMQVEARNQVTVVDLLPTNPNAARLRAIVPKDPNEGVTLVAGRGSFFEIPAIGGRYTGQPLIQELEIICRAVISGKLEENVIFDGDELLQGKGKIQLPDTMIVRWRRPVFRLFRKKEKKQFNYESYRSIGQV
jgi:hypothetical protein